MSDFLCYCVLLYQVDYAGLWEEMIFLWGFPFQLAPCRDTVTLGTTCLCGNVTVLCEKIVLFLLHGSSLERLVNQSSL